LPKILLLKTTCCNKIFSIDNAEVNITDYLIQKLDYYVSLMKQPNFLFIGNEDEKNFLNLFQPQ